MKGFIAKYHPEPQELVNDKFDEMCHIGEDYLIAFSRWYRIKCAMSNFDMFMTAEKAIELFKNEHNYD